MVDISDYTFWDRLKYQYAEVYCDQKAIGITNENFLNIDNNIENEEDNIHRYNCGFKK